MIGRLAAVDLDAVSTATSIYRCRTTGYAAVSLTVCNRGTSSANITISISDTVNATDLAGTIEFQHSIPAKDVLERTGIVVGSTQYLTITSSSTDISIIVMGAETGEFDSDIAAIPLPVFTWSSTYAIDNPNDYGQSADDEFGKSIAIGNNYMVAGADLEDDAGGSASGKAYVFNTSTGALTYTLDNPNGHDTTAGDRYGFAVAVSDNHIVVSAPYEDDANGTSQGKVYVYNPSTGGLTRTIDNPSSSYLRGDQFGWALAIDSDTLLVGAHWYADYDGRAYLINASTGSVLHTLENPNSYDELGTDNDTFGESVAIHGNLCIVGAPHEDKAGSGTSGSRVGAAYIFNVSTGATEHTLLNPDLDNDAENDQFGESVAIHGSYAAVGAPGEGSTPEGGYVYIYNTSTGALVQSIAAPADEDCWSIGRLRSLAMNADYVFVGDYGATIDGEFGQGKVYVYRISTGALVHTIVNPQTASGVNNSQYFGSAVAAVGNRIAVAEERHRVGGANFAGKAHIYDLD